MFTLDDESVQPSVIDSKIKRKNLNYEKKETSSSLKRQNMLQSIGKSSIFGQNQSETGGAFSEMVKSKKSKKSKK